MCRGSERKDYLSIQEVRRSLQPGDCDHSRLVNYEREIFPFDRRWPMHMTSFMNSQRGVAFAVWLSLLVWSVFLLPNPAMGQGSATASLAGTVRDPSGAVIPGAQIVITQTDTGFSKPAVSSDNGSFAFAVLPVGPYRLEVRKEGFASYQQTGIVLTVNQAAQLPVTLQVGEITEV